jgi:hypothetical protein
MRYSNPSFTLFAGWWVVLVLVLMLMLICCERKILLNGWLILTDKLKRAECLSIKIYSNSYGLGGIVSLVRDV